MGDRRKQALRVQFDGKLKLEFHGANITSDAGLLAFRELDEAFRLTEKGSTLLSDRRRGKNTQHSLLAMLRQSVYGRLAGYEDVNDADRLRVDPAMRRIVGGRAKEKEAASTSEMSRFETVMLSSRKNLTALMNLSGTWIDSVQECAPLDKLILDLDSSVSETHGQQQGSAYNGYFECTCYHPLFLFNQFGDLERAMLRRGNHNSAKFWRRVLLPVIDRYRDRDIPKYFRGDAAFAIPGLYGVLEEESFQYTIRIPSNDVLAASISHLLTRPVGRPSHKPKVFYESFSYQAQGWDRPRRVVAKVEWHWDQLFPRVGFIVTNMSGWSRKVVKFYNGRGTAEQWIKEGKYAVKWTRLSCRNFRDNQTRLQLFALAYNLGNFLRRLALPRSVKHWSLTTLREKLIKIGAKVVRHSGYVIFQMAEVAVPRELFAAILERIQRFGVPPPLLQRG
ncbi:MAG: IS1380 family transposase [Planctomycetes bacterium]|nr:IS1380 family transposase [Planctomycetota bacterium]